MRFRSLIHAFLALALSTISAPILADEVKPLVIKNGQTRQVPSTDTLSVPKLDITTTSRAITNMNGTSESIYVNKAALNAEIAYGSYADPITIMGPSLKVSRVEKLTTTDCNGTYNNNECNAAIVGAATGHKDDLMQTAGVVGVALGYQEGPNPADTSLDSVGVQGQGRIVGNGIGVGTGGFFQGIADSSTSRAIGVESNIKNLTGADAAANIVDGGSFPNILVSCGAGTYPSQWKCNSGIQITNSGRNYNYGVVVTAAADIASFVDNSSAQTGLALFGTHTHQILGNEYAVTGSGKVWIGSSYNSATTTGLTVRQGGGTQAYFGSTGANNSAVVINAANTGQQSIVQFTENDTVKWEFARNASNAFVLYDTAASKNMVSATTNGDLVLGGGGNIAAAQNNFLYANGYIARGAVPTMSGTCSVNTPTGGMTAGTFTVGGATCNNPSTIIMTFATAAPAGWACNMRDITVPGNTMNQTAYTTTTVTFTGQAASGDRLVFSCQGF